MKRSFYEMLGVARDASQAEIDTAYKRATSKLNAVNLRGTAAATLEARLLLDGYQILSNHDKRATYDEQLAASESDVPLMVLPGRHAAQRWRGVEVFVLAVFVTVLGGVGYHHLSIKMDELRVEHEQAVIRKKEERNKVIIVDTTKSEPTIAGATRVEQKR